MRKMDLFYSNSLIFYLFIYFPRCVYLILFKILFKIIYLFKYLFVLIYHILQQCIYFVFRQWFGRPGFNTKDSKKVLDAALLNTQHYKVRIQCKVEPSRERSNPLPYTSM